MARIPAVSFRLWSLANFAALYTNPSIVGVLDVGLFRFQSRWLSSQEGERLSVHTVAKWNAVTLLVPSALGLDAVAGNPSNCCEGNPFACQYAGNCPKYVSYERFSCTMKMMWLIGVTVGFVCLLSPWHATIMRDKNIADALKPKRTIRFAFIVFSACAGYRLSTWSLDEADKRSVV